MSHSDIMMISNRNGARQHKRQMYPTTDLVGDTDGVFQPIVGMSGCVCVRVFFFGGGRVGAPHQCPRVNQYKNEVDESSMESE